MNTREILIAARALVAKGWTQGTFARDAEGHSMASSSGCACRWCPLGALLAVAAGGTYSLSDGIAALASAARLGKGRGVDVWNDHPERTQEEVLAAFDRAIAACEAQS